MYAFGQHSGVIDKTKNKFELPRFPINEKYGEEKDLKVYLNLFRFLFKILLLIERYLAVDNNPHEVNISRFEDGPDIEKYIPATLTKKIAGEDQI